ncbi:MAG: LptF/LptG family permease [Candidatus Eisenbacteria bacterium]
MRPILSFYVLRRHLGPFIFAILIITFLFIMDLLIDYIDLFLGKGIPLGVVIEVFFLSLGWMAALTIPMSVLVATVMAFGGLSGRNEITAMKAAGVSIYQIVTPPLLLSLLLAYGLIEFNNRVLPESNHRLAGLLVDIHRKRPALAIKQGMFNDVQGHTIRVERLNAKTSEIGGVTIQRKVKGEETETIVAKTGLLEFSRGGDVLTLYLRDGEIHGVGEKNADRYHRISFETHTIRITDIGTDLVRSEKNTRGDRELSAADMRERVHGYREELEEIRAEHRDAAKNHLDARFGLLGFEGPRAPEGAEEPEGVALARRNYARELRNTATRLGGVAGKTEDRKKQIRKYMVEIHKKYALPVACVVFVLVGAPLGVRAHGGGLGIGVGFSILFFVVYYIFLIGGEKLADRGHVPPAAAMWAANVVIGIVGVILVLRSTRESGALRLPRLLFPRGKKR